MPTFSARGQRAVVIGGGRSGVAAAELLATQGALVTLTDLKPSLPDTDRLRSMGIRLVLGSHPPDLVSQADLVVVSPGVTWRQPLLDLARAAGALVIGEIELAWRLLQGRVIAITGTKGKSTTTTLVGRILEAGGIPATVGGNLGQPLSAQVATSTPDTLHVVEVSSFQLEATSTFRPWIAVLLNLSTDHLDRHADFDEYREAKAQLFARQTADDRAVVNADDPHALELATQTRARVIRYALERPLDEGFGVDGGMIVERRGGRVTPLVPVSAVRLLGRHLLGDVVAATAVARLSGAAPEAMVKAISGFDGLEHALERVADIRGVRFVNDSKATNIEAARRSIESFDRGVVPIMGGRYKGGEFRDLRAAVAARASAIVAIGEARPLVREALGDLVPVIEAPSMAAAVRLAFDAAPEGGTVVLAPACSSFDMFADYAERGRVFKEEVRRLRMAVETRDER